jgi:hypothetical protein
MYFYAIRKNWTPTPEMKVAIVRGHIELIGEMNCTKCNEVTYQLWVSPLDRERHIVDVHENLVRDALLRHCPDHQAIINN